MAKIARKYNQTSRISWLNMRKDKLIYRLSQLSQECEQERSYIIKQINHINKTLETIS